MPPPRRPHPAGVRASGQRAATPPAASARDRPGNCSPPPSAGYSSAPFRENRRGSAGIRGKLQEGAGPRTVPYPLSAAVLQPFSARVSAAEDMRAAETLDAVGPGNGSPPPRRAVPSGRGLMSNSRLPSSGSHRDQVPDSVTDIDRPAAVPIHRGAMMPRSCSSI